MERDEASPEQQGEPLPKLHPLHPQNYPAEHGDYVQWLKDGINAPKIWNIALTGGYGIGKSSILAGLDEHYPATLISLSMSTSLAKPKSSGGSSDEDESEAGQLPDIESSPKN